MKRNKRSMFLIYFLSYSGIAVFVTASIGLLMLSLSVSENKEAALKNLEYRLRLAADDIESQFDMMRDIASEIKTKPYYTRFYNSRNNFYDLDLISDFKKYESHISRGGNYYLLNKETGAVYSANSKYIFAHFVKYVYSINDTARMRSVLYDTPGLSVFIDGEYFFMTQSLNINGGRNPAGDSCLIYVVTRNAMLTRVRDISGIVPGRLMIEILGVTVTNDGDSDAGQIAVPSSGSRVLISARAEDYDLYADVVVFQRTIFLILGMSVILSIMLATLAAWQSYKPINQILSKFQMKEKISRNEFDQIETLVETLTVQARTSQHILTERVAEFEKQSGWLKQQVLTSILCGTFDSLPRESLTSLGIKLTHRMFCIMICQRSDGEQFDDEQIKLIESMSDEDAWFYAIRLRDTQCIAILMNMSDHDQVATAQWMLIEALSSSTSPIVVRVGTIVDDIDKLPLSFMVAYSNEAPYAQSDALESARHVNAECYETLELNMALAHIRSGEGDSALTHFDHIFKMIEANAPSLIYRKLVYFNVINELVRESNKLQIRVPDDILSTLLFSGNMNNDEMKEGVSAIVMLLSNQAERNMEEESDGVKRNVIDYIDAHISDDQLSADAIASELSLSSRQVGRIVKALTGCSFKEYINNTRMKRAEALLSEGELSVTEVARNVGYTNIPYFIRIFKARTGYSPGEYRKNFVTGRPFVKI